MTSLTAGQAREARELERLFEADITAAVGRKRRGVALMLSGGVDSTSVGLAAHRLGHEVHAYTFRLKGEQTFDSKWAERTARIMGWEWTPIDLPTDIGVVVRDWPRLYFDLQCRKKREFECAWPFLRVYPVVREQHVLNGLHAGSFFHLNRLAVKRGIGAGFPDRRAFDAARVASCAPWLAHGAASLSIDYNPSCLLQHRKLQAESGLIDVNPFLSREVNDFFMRFDWRHLNVPKQKQHLRWIYADDVAKVGSRNPKSYQLAGNIDRHFEGLLSTPVNYMNRSRTLDMFGDYWHPSRELEAVQTCRALERLAKRRR